MNEEEYIRTAFSRENPFRVPEGYFESLTQRVMEQVPQQQKPRPRQAILQRLRPLLYAAACLCVAIFSVAIYLHQTNDDTVATAALDNAADYSYVDEVADYAMVDNYEIYACLTGDSF